MPAVFMGWTSVIVTASRRAGHEAQADAREEHGQPDDRRPAEGLDLAAAPQVPAGHAQDHPRPRDQRRQQRVRQAHRNTLLVKTAVMLVSWARPARRDLVADRVLHPGVGGQDEHGGEGGPHGREVDRHQVQARRDPVPPEDPDPEERRLQEEGGEALDGQRGAEHVADVAGVGRPVHAELELLHEPGDHADRHVDQQDLAEELGEPQPLVVAGPAPGRLHDRGQPRQPDGERDEQEVEHRRQPELPPGELDVAHPSNLRTGAARLIAHIG